MIRTVLPSDATTVSPKSSVVEEHLKNPAKNATISRSKRLPTRVASDHVVLPGGVTRTVASDQVMMAGVTRTSDQGVLPGATSSFNTTVAGDQVLPGVTRGGHMNILNGVETFRESMRGGFGVVDAVTRTCELGNVRAPKELWLV